MAHKAISRAVRRQVRDRACNRCEYCQHPASYACAPFVCEHIRPRARGACLGRNMVPLPSLPVLAKHHAQAYLATRQDVQMFPGIAAYRDYWPWTNPIFQPLIQFLQAL